MTASTIAVCRNAALSPKMLPKRKNAPGRAAGTLPKRENASGKRRECSQRSKTRRVGQCERLRAYDRRMDAAQGGLTASFAAECRRNRMAWMPQMCRYEQSACGSRPTRAGLMLLYRKMLYKCTGSGSDSAHSRTAVCVAGECVSTMCAVRLWFVWISV